MNIEIPQLDKLTIENFIETFKRIFEWKKEKGQRAYYDNPGRATLKAQAQFYGMEYGNGALGWTENIWSRSKGNSSVVNASEDLTEDHRILMRGALEYVLGPNTLVKVDGVYGRNPKAKFHMSLYVDGRYPDAALRWRELTFKPSSGSKPDMEGLFLPGLWTPATMPGSNGKVPMFIIRFPNHNFTVETISSYVGEFKKGCLCHWINHVYEAGGTGVHAGTREFEALGVDGRWKDVGMVIWGLTGSGKSTHGLYVFDEDNAEVFNKRGVDVLNLVRHQRVKNDDIVGLFVEGAYGSEAGAWTKVDGITPKEVLLYRAAMSPRAMHANLGQGEDGNPDFLDEHLSYMGNINPNPRTVFYLADMAPYFDGNIDIEFPPTMAVFISPGYLTDYAWAHIADRNLALAIYTAGRTVGHPAMSAKGVGEEKFVTQYNPFIMGATPADHIHRFRDILVEREKMATTGVEPLKCYLVNSTGRVGTPYEWKDGDAIPVFKEKGGKRVPAGGTGPSIEETEVFILQEARGAVKYEPHPIWGEKLMVPVEIPGIPAERLKELNPFTYRSEEEMRKLLMLQLEKTRKVFETQVKGLDDEIARAMDF